MRANVGIALDVAGIDCTIYIPTTSSLNQAEGLDVFETVNDLSFLSYSGQCFIAWNLNKYRLRKLGIYTEDDIPMVIWVPYKATALEGSEAGSLVDIDVVQKSYIKIEQEFIPDNTKDVTEFELVDIRIKGTHDSVIGKSFKGVPRRIERE
jgi:hypothetical protein